MKGILKKIGSAFVEEVEEKKVSLPEKPPPTSEVTQIVQPTYTPYSVGMPEYEEFKDKFRNILSEENKRNFPGNDYFEFKTMKDAMNSIGDNTVKYQAAFAGWSVGGSQTKQNLLDTAKVYLGLVDKEIQEFEDAYKVQYNEQVTGNEKLIETKAKRVQALVEEMNTLNTEISRLKQDNLTNTSKLTSKHDAFMAAGQAQRNEILEEMNNINKYIN